MKQERLVRIVVLALMSLILISPLAWGAEGDRVVVTLPESVNVYGPDLLLGTIGEITGPPELIAQVTAINAGAAPRPGSSRRLTKGQIEVRLRQGGLDLSKIEFRGAATVQVYGVVQPHTAQALPQTGAGFPIYEIVVAARDLPKGTLITLADLTVEEREIKSGQPDLRSAEDFAGLRTSRHVLSGAALTNLNVEAVPAIERGTQVTILVRTSSLVVSAPGIARGTGGVGDVISVENTLSRQIVTGEIIDSQTVQVNLRGSGTP